MCARTSESCYFVELWKGVPSLKSVFKMEQKGNQIFFNLRLHSKLLPHVHWSCKNLRENGNNNTKTTFCMIWDNYLYQGYKVLGSLDEPISSTVQIAGGYLLKLLL